MKLSVWMKVRFVVGLIWIIIGLNVWLKKFILMFLYVMNMVKKCGLKLKWMGYVIVNCIENNKLVDECWFLIFWEEIEVIV